MEKAIIRKSSPVVPLVGFFFAAYFLIVRYIWPINLQELSKEWLVAELVLFSLLSFCCWLTFEHRKGLLFTGVTVSVVFIVALKTGVAGLYNLLLLNLLIAAVFYLPFQKLEKLGVLNEEEVNKIQEDKNIQLAGYSRKKEKLAALHKKKTAYLRLKKITEALSSTYSMEKIVDFMAINILKTIGKGELSLIFLVEEKTQGLALAGSYRPGTVGFAKIKAKKGDDCDNWVLKQRQVLLVEDIKKEFRFNVEEIKGENGREFHSLISAPMVSKKKVIGVLRLESSRAGEFNFEDLRLLNIIANLSSVAVQNALLYQYVEELAIKDGLTGLFVHRYFQERFQEEIQRAITGNANLSLLMADLDHFKVYNDTYGHIAGDLLLKGIANILRESADPGDFVARYGGEEFVLLLPHRSKKEAAELAETIRKRVQGSSFMVRNKTTKITISMGVAAFPSDGNYREILLEKADTALYRAKEEGRNRINTGYPKG